MPDRWVSRLSAVRSAVRMPAVVAGDASAGSPGISAPPSGDQLQELGGERATVSKTASATGPPASTPGCRGVMFGRAELVGGDGGHAS